jgi:predicted SAM-dependent methyltransferase
MKLEIGGEKPREGYINLNNDERVNPDCLMDAFITLPFRDNTFEEVYSSHVIEHAGWNEVDTILQEWVRILKPNGKLILLFPDFAYHVKKYLENPTTLHGPGGLMYGLYGHQEPPQFRHRAAYDKDSMEKKLINCGLTDFKYNEENLWEINVTATKL